MNKDLAIEKGLIIGNDDKKYKDLENVYKYLFEKFLVSQVNIKKYDDLINNSNYYIGVTKPNEDKIKSGLNEYLGTYHLYLVNNFYIEKLSLEDIKLLENFYNTKSFDDQVFNVVIRTYKDVINRNFHRGEYLNKKVKICYGVAVPKNFADSDSIVFKIFYGRNTKDLKGQEYAINMMNQQQLFNNIKNELEKEVKDKFGIPCTVLIEKLYN